MDTENEITIEFSEDQQAEIIRKCGFVPKPIVTNGLSLTMLSLAATAKNSDVLPLVNRLSTCRQILELGKESQDNHFYTLTLDLTDEQRQQIREIVNKDWQQIVIVPDDYEVRYKENWDSDSLIQRIGKSFVIVSEKTEYTATDDEKVIKMPSVESNNTTFGTGNHPTTQAVLQLLEKYFKPNMDVLDVGTGSGILAVAAAKLGAKKVLGIDVDPAAIETAEIISKINNVSEKVLVETGDIDLVEDTFDLVTANLIPKIIIPIAPTLAEKVVPNGIIILSGLVSARIPEITEVMQNVGFEKLEDLIVDFWGGIAFQKRI